MDVSSNDWAIRAAAFRQVRRLLETRDHLESADLQAGFQFDGERVPFINPQRGIFKPRKMEALLSIRTVFPRSDARVWYDDQREVHSQIFESEESVDYSFMGTDANAADNRWLREAMERQVPIIYFLGIAPGKYDGLIPTFVTGWDATRSKAKISFSDPFSKNLPKAPTEEAERRYALRLVKQRLHQATFRQAVIAAYRGRCALSGLPEPMLLDAAHIISDTDENLGHPVVPNGVPLSKIHHAAFDAHLIGIDPDLRIHVAARLLKQKDGVMLDALKQLHGRTLMRPDRSQDEPDRERLKCRFEQFKAAA